jgi:hypothetical protein
MSHTPRDPEMSGTPDRKFDVDLAERRVEKLTTVDVQYEIDAVIDKRVTRKFDFHILPWLFGIWYAARVRDGESCIY